MPIFTNAQEALDYVSMTEREGIKCEIRTTVFGEYNVICKFPQGTVVEIPVKPVVKQVVTVTQKQNVLQEHNPMNLSLPAPYDYQEDAVRQALTDRHIIIEIPTGKGKTNIGLEIINRLKMPALIIVPTILLLEQWNRDIRNAGGSATTVSGASVKFSAVTVITYASALKYLDEITKYGLVIFDEVHHLFSSEYRKIVFALLDANVPYLVGLTATVREFGTEKELQDRLFPNRFVRTMAQFQEHAETAVPIELVEQGVQMTDEESEDYEAYTDTIRNALKRFGDISGIQKAMRSPNPENRKYAMAGLSSIAKRKQLLSEMTPKLEEAVRIIRENQGQFIVFAESITSAEYIHNSLLRLGVPSILIHSNLKTDRIARERIMNDLKSGRARVLVGVISISEGINLPDMNQGIILSPSVAGRRQYVQRLGRILRYRPGKRAKLWVLFAMGTVEERNLNIIRNLVK